MQRGLSAIAELLVLEDINSSYDSKDKLVSFSRASKIQKMATGASGCCCCAHIILLVSRLCADNNDTVRDFNFR